MNFRKNLSSLNLTNGGYKSGGKTSHIAPVVKVTGVAGLLGLGIWALIQNVYSQ